MFKINGLSVTLLITSSLTIMAGAIIAPALPEMSAYFNGQAAEVYIKLLLTIPAIGIVLFSSLIGSIADKWGRKPVLLLSLLLFGLSGTSGIWIDNLYVLLASRFMLGIAVAGIMNAATAMVGDYFDPQARSKFLGLQASFMSIGGILFLNIGGILAEWSWRGPFYLYALSFLIMLLVWTKLPVISGARVALDRQENRLPPNLLKIVYVVFIMGFLGMVFFYLIPVQIPYLLKVSYGSSNTLIGFAISLATLTGALASFNYTRVAAYFSTTKIYGLSFLFLGAGYFLIATSGSVLMTMAGLAISGIGTGLMMPNGNLILLSILPDQVKGKWLGGLTTAIFLGQFLSPIIVSPIVSGYSIEMAFACVSGAALLVSTVLLFQKEKEILKQTQLINTIIKT